MGFLKGFFVEEVPQEEDYDFGQIIEDVDVGGAELDAVRTDTLIEDIYSQNELADKTKSIFKIEELINSLPKEMVTETKRNSVLATLEVFGLNESDVENDGMKRTEILNSILIKILEEADKSIREKEEEIENHKKEIERLEKEISAQQLELKSSQATIEAENKRIVDLIKFIKGDNE